GTGPAVGTERLRSDHRDHHPRPGHRRPAAPPDRDARRADRHRHCPHTLNPTTRRRGGRAAGPLPLACPGADAMTATTSAAGPPPPAAGRLRPADVARVASVGLRTRKLRAALSATGIAIGVAAIVAVLGLSASSSAGLLAEISKLGTNLLTVTNGQNLF